MPVKANKKISKKEEVIVETVSEDDGSETEISESEEEPESESEEESEEESGSAKNKKKEKVSKKLTFDEIFQEINIILEEETKLEAEIVELDKTLILKTKKRSVLRKEKNKLLNLLPKAFTDGCNKAVKEKKKRTNTSRSGILKENPVPPILIKFFGLKENTLLPRPKVFHLLNEKFKELGLKKGQDTFLDKKTAKLFGVEEGHVIKFKEHQTFLANIYNNAEKKNEVSL
jgi:hypothetical protein